MRRCGLEQSVSDGEEDRVSSAAGTSWLRVAAALRLLLLDDRRSAARTLRQYLVDHAPSWTLDWVTEADLCVGRALNRHYDVVLIDENLRQSVSGLDVCRELRCYACSAPLLIYAADDSHAARFRAHEAGADAFLSKDLKAREFIARVLEVFLNPPQRAIRQCASLSLDLRRMKVYAHDTSVEVTRADYRILLELTAHIGKTVPYLRLCEVSGTQPGANFSNLHALVHRLRRKLGETGRLLQTEQTDGYRLCRPPWPGFSTK